MSAEIPAPQSNVAAVGSHDREAPIAIAVAAPAAPTLNVQFWLTLTPLLSILLTAIALVINSWLALSQSREQRSQEKQTQLLQARRDQEARDAAEDADWRQALSKLTGEKGNELAALLLMDTFVTSSRHGQDARSFAADLINRAPYHSAFDVVLFRIKNNTTDANEEDLLSIDRGLASEALDLYATKIARRPPTFEMFREKRFQDILVDPTHGLALPGEDMLQQQFTELNWRLDSVSDAIVSTWAARHASPVGNLNGIILLNQDQRDINYADRRLDLSRTAFLGDCKLPTEVNQPTTIACQ